MKKTTHTHSLNSYIYTHTHARKTREKKNYDEKQENRVKEGIFFRSFFSLFFFFCYIYRAWQVVFVYIISLIFISPNWTTDENLSNHLILSCIMNLRQIRYVCVVLFALLRCCCCCLFFLEGIDRSSSKKKEAKKERK